MIPKFVECKTLGHAWEVNHASLRRSSFGNALTFRCLRCTSERVDIYSFHQGDLLGRRYHYVEGYREAQRMTRGELRLELVRQAREVNRLARALA